MALSSATRPDPWVWEIGQLRRLGCDVYLEGDAIRVRPIRPPSDPSAIRALVEKLAARKAEAVAALKAEPSSERWVPWIGEMVRVGNAVGRLVQVFRDRVTVVVEGEAQARFVRPEEVQPVWDGQHQQAA